MADETDIQRLRKIVDIQNQLPGTIYHVPSDGSKMEVIPPAIDSGYEVALAIREVGAELCTAIDYLSSEIAMWRSESAERGAYPLQVRVDK